MARVRLSPPPLQSLHDLYKYTNDDDKVGGTAAYQLLLLLPSSHKHFWIKTLGRTRLSTNRIWQIKRRRKRATQKREGDRNNSGK